jgi:hypothetical protein
MGLFSKSAPETGGEPAKALANASNSPEAVHVVNYSHGFGQSLGELTQAFGGDQKLIDAAIRSRARAKHAHKKDPTPLDFDDAAACKAYLFDVHGHAKS